MSARWFHETLHPGLRMGIEADSVLFDSETEHQRLVIIENRELGRVMLLDGVVQTTEADEFIYHEMLAHVPILAHGHAKRVLIIGGGDGGMLEEVLKHPMVEHVTMVEIDRAVTELAKQYLPNICGDAFDDPRTELVIADGVKFAAESDQTYDVVITDSTDPIGPGEVLFTEGFYASCRKRLKAGGILVTQNGVPFLQAEELRGSMTKLNALFADATCYLAAVPMYVGGTMAFGWASDDPAHRQVALATLEERYRGAGLAGRTRYYTPAVHQAAFALPPFVEQLIR